MKIELITIIGITLVGIFSGSLTTTIKKKANRSDYKSPKHNKGGISISA